MALLTSFQLLVVFWTSATEPTLVSDQRTARDFAECMRDLADIHYPDADRIRVVMDNLSTHTAGALYEAFPAPEAHRVLQHLEFHYTPKHASWLNMVEIEIGVLRGQCLRDRRMAAATQRVWRADQVEVHNAKGARSWHVPIRTPPKSHNHCAEVLALPGHTTGQEPLGSSGSRLPPYDTLGMS
jgi:hypothetical protein